MTDTPTNQQNELWLMLGEIRGDVKFLVNERSKTSERLDGLEIVITEKAKRDDERFTKLEHFKTRFMAYAGLIALAIPTFITFIYHQFQGGSS